MHMIMNAFSTMPHFACAYGESAWYPPLPHTHARKRTSEDLWIATRGGKWRKGEPKRGDLKKEKKWSHRSACNWGLKKNNPATKSNTPIPPSNKTKKRHAHTRQNIKRREKKLLKTPNVKKRKKLLETTPVEKKRGGGGGGGGGDVKKKKKREKKVHTKKEGWGETRQETIWVC